MEEIDKLLERIQYKDGKLYWTNNARLSGKEAGCKVNGYIVIRYKSGKGGYILAHRLIFYMFHGFIPEMIDHIDRNTMNNSIENLRPADKKLNSINRGLQSNNTSGVRGVYYDRGMWVPYIGVDNKRIKFGRYRNKSEAIAIRKEAELKYWGDLL